MKPLAGALLSALGLTVPGAVLAQNLQGIAQIDTNGYSTCAVTASGAAKCWGDNAVGELGNGSDQSSALPVDVASLASGVASVSTMPGMACALLKDGTVRCWGNNYLGQLGDRTTVQRSTPVQVLDLTERAVSVAVSDMRGCALTESGKLFCWGNNSAGQFGLGSSAQGAVSAVVTTLRVPVRQVALGSYHSCVLTNAGGVKCWANQGAGVAAGAASGDVTVPTDVPGLAGGVVAIAAGYSFTCAAMETGRVKCWGRNDHGQLGDGSVGAGRAAPTEVPGLVDVVSLSARESTACALTAAGKASCWGANEMGQLGDRTFVERHSPVAAAIDERIAAISVGSGAACALLVGGESRCWGRYYHGALGDGRIVTESNRPTAVPTLTSGVAAVSVGSSRFCALMTDATVKCAGNNYDGDVGNGTFDLQVTPVTVASGAIAVRGGPSHECAIVRNGDIDCWGSNRTGQLGDGADTFSRAAPAPVVGLARPALAIAAGTFYTCAIVQGGRVQCWGSALQGALARSVDQVFRQPVDIPGISGATAIAGGEESFACAVIAGGAVTCWGAPIITRGTTAVGEPITPVAIAGLESGVVSLAAGRDFICALTSAGTVKCWGRNGSGQLGDGTTADRFTPAEVAGLSGVRAIAAAGMRACAVLSTGAVACWGENTYGGLGDGTLTMRTRPVTIIESGVASVDMTVSLGCAVKTSGSLLCWGSDVDGYLRGARPASTSPVAVAAGTGVAAPANWQDMWWAGPQENGWGMSITQHGETLFGAIFTYDGAGAARWYVMPGGTWSADKRVYSGQLYFPAGAPYSAYDTSRFVPGRPAGSVQLTFTSATSMEVDGLFGDTIFRKVLTRQIFAVGTAMNNLSDMWWGGFDENGWGTAITQQGDTTFAVWYTYDASGLPTWFVMPGGTWNAARTRYSGTLYSTSNPRGWLAGSYDASALLVNTVGSMAFDFAAPSAATMSYAVGGLTQSKPIVRQPF